MKTCGRTETMSSTGYYFSSFLFIKWYIVRDDVTVMFYCLCFVYSIKIMYKLLINYTYERGIFFSLMKKITKIELVEPEQ